MKSGFLVPGMAPLRVKGLDHPFCDGCGRMCRAGSLRGTPSVVGVR
jgi:hypothetical protein